MYILGISAFYHDSAACLLKDDEILAAAQEERFTRIKHDFSFPHHSIKYCLKKANISASQIDNIIFYERLLDILSKSQNPIEGHYMERLWCYIFTKNKPLLNSCLDVFKTKIERFKIW